MRAIVDLREMHDQRLALLLERHVETLVAEHADALALELERTAMRELAADLALALVADVIDQRGDGGEHMGELARRLTARRSLPDIPRR